jgi:hypothetical protein
MGKGSGPGLRCGCEVTTGWTQAGKSFRTSSWALMGGRKLASVKGTDLIEEVKKDKEGEATGPVGVEELQSLQFFFYFY